VYAKATIPATDKVCLWLGANVMLEYTLGRNLKYFNGFNIFFNKFTDFFSVARLERNIVIAFVKSFY
jgi:hypothetical protein